MARKPAPGTRDRILDEAARLFYEHGIHAVGLQQIIDACGCGKNLLYREFASKDDLVVAYLERSRQCWAAMVDRATRPFVGDATAQLLAIVRAVADDVARADFRGCPFLNTHAEFPDPDHPAHQVCVEHLEAIRAQLRQLAEQAGARDPQLLADRLMLIVDGLYANGAVLRTHGPAAAGVDFAVEIIRAATPRSPVRPVSPVVSSRGARSRVAGRR
jgi:AcrR family transcriptional regulator